MKCKDCIYFNKKENQESQEYFKCSSPKFDIGYGDHIDPQQNDVLVEGDEGWGFLVGPEFGCVHFRKELCIHKFKKIKKPEEYTHHSWDLVTRCIDCGEINHGSQIT